MPKRSTVLSLPPELLLELDGRIIEAGYGAYADHAAFLAGQGHALSVSALQRYGVALRAQLDPATARIRLNSAIRARVRAETARRGERAEVAASALDLAEELLQERLHAILEAGEQLDGEALAQVSATLANLARARGALSRVERAEADKTGRRGRPLSPGGEKAIRDAVQGRAR